MSEDHAKRMLALQAEYRAAREALEDAVRISEREPRRYTSGASDFLAAYRNAEKTYFVRVVAEGEGMLYRHLRDHFPSLPVAEAETATPLINAVRTRLDARRNRGLPTGIAEEALEVVRYRNWLAHGEKSAPPAEMTFDEAIERFKRLVLALPPMKTR